MRTLLTGATVVLPTGPERLNLLIDDGRIAHVGVPAGARADETLDLTGLHVFPGVIDDQVHFREPGLTHKEDLTTGSRAAARGGVTTFFDMPNVSPATTTVERLHEKLARAAEVSRVNYAFFIGATGSNLAELQRAERTPGIKVFIGSSTGDLLVDDQDALERLFAETTLPITAHCEDEATVRANRAALLDDVAETGRALVPLDHLRVRDHAAAAVSARRTLDLAIRHRHRFHLLHVTTRDEINLLQSVYQDPDIRSLITAEACVPHLWFSADDYDRLGTRLLQNPSVKHADDRTALWDGLRDGTLQIVATDHAPHTLDEKARPYPDAPSGMPSIENSLALMLTKAHEGACQLTDIAQWMADAPAQTWGLAAKGRIEDGFDADLAVVDVNARRVLRDAEQLSKSGWTPWDGVEVRAEVVGTIVGGRRVYWRGLFDETVRGREAVFSRP